MTDTSPIVQVVVDAGAVEPLRIRICNRRDTSSGIFSSREALIVCLIVAEDATSWSAKVATKSLPVITARCHGEAVVLIVAVVSPVAYPFRPVSNFALVAVTPS